MSSDRRARGGSTLVLHVVYSFSVGGLENVVVQLINRLPSHRFEHVVLSLTTTSDFRDRVTLPGVRFIELHKKPGHAIPLYPRIWRLVRELQPDVVHTCNLAALELVPLAWLARVPLRIHAEHGWDAHDPEGLSLRYRLVRKLYKPFVSHYVAVSRDLYEYLGNAIGIPKERRSLVSNGVDIDIFRPSDGILASPAGCPFAGSEHWVIGTVGRMQSVKNQPLLARAFVRLVQDHPEAADRLRLVMVGDGPLRAEVEEILVRNQLMHLAWLPGIRADIADLLRCMSCFVLPSRAEGTSCTLQEAMACGLPVVATAVGGTPELIESGVNGQLVPSEDEASMADALWMYYQQPQKAHHQGLIARQTVVERYSLSKMVGKYKDLFSRRSKSEVQESAQ